MRIDALVGGANSKTSGSYLRDLRGKNIIDEIIPLKVIAKSYPLRNVSNQTSHNQMSFLPTASTIIHGGLSKGMPQGLFLPVSSRATQTVKRGFQFEEEIIGNNSGRASNFNPTEFSYNMDAKKVSMLGANDNSHKDLQNSHVNLDIDYCDVPTGRELILYGEGGSQSKLLSAANRNNDINQNHTLTAPEPIREGIKSSQHPAVIPRPTPRKRAATESSSSDRLRRARKTENLKALRELLPHSRKGTILAVTEEVIDYIKYLQLQIKVLTQSRLGGEPTFDPFIHLEGFGHYLLHDQMLNEPLEMTIGRMMEGNMSVVTQLLETKGLYVMPMPSEPGP